MGLKEEFEILRGTPIKVFEGDPLSIPCIETSDAERLCKNPVVSVHMLAYNHESYIRQAIEGVMAQKTDFEFELQGNENDFQTGLTALSKMAKTYLGIGAKQKAAALVNAQDVEINIFDGKCPAGNVGVQVNHVDPVNKGEVVWTVDPSAVIFFGRLFNTGKVNLTRTVAICGDKVQSPAYADVLVGTKLGDILNGNLADGNLRVINGNVLTGVKSSLDDYLGAHASEL